MTRDKFHTFTHPLFWISVVLFIVNQMLERIYGIFLPFIHAYLDDLLCMPIVLGLATQIIQWIHPAGKYYYLSKNHILIAVVMFSMVFELIFPITDPTHYTSDMLDILFYTVGAFLFYWLVVNKTKKEWEEKMALMKYS